MGNFKNPMLELGPDDIEAIRPHIDGKVIAITGGTGSFGKCMLRTLLTKFNPKKLIVLSRDELKQSNMHVEFQADLDKVRFFLGDIRDYDRLLDALNGVDLLMHAAALKQVPALEYNPFEAIKTNVIGANNIIRAANACGVKRILALSTDKAASPINLYGATKLCQDKLMVAANFMYPEGPQVAVVRYGNVFGSRGSVVPVFLKQKDSGFLNVTDERMTRFSITLPQGIAFVLNCLKVMLGGEIFIPRIPSYEILTLAKTLAPKCKINVTGIRPGEKLHEVMVPQDEAINTVQFDGHFVITPAGQEWFAKTEAAMIEKYDGKKCDVDFVYASDNNKEWLDEEDVVDCLEAYENQAASDDKQVPLARLV